MVVFLYINNEQSIKEIFKNQVASKQLNILEQTTKEVKDLYTVDYKTLLKEIKKTQMSGNPFHVHWLDDLIFFKCPYYPKRSII